MKSIATPVITPVLVIAGSREMKESYHPLLLRVAGLVQAQFTQLTQSQKCCMLFTAGRGVCSWWELEFQNKFPQEDFSLIPVQPEWERFGKGAGPLGTKKVLEMATKLGHRLAVPVSAIAFPSPTSKGTRNFIKAATELGIPLTVYELGKVPRRKQVS